MVHDVVIVGYGPAGILAAILLGRAGRRVAVGERHKPGGDIDTAAVDSLKELDPNRPIIEAGIGEPFQYPHLGHYDARS